MKQPTKRAKAKTSKKANKVAKKKPARTAAKGKKTAKTGKAGKAAAGLKPKPVRKSGTTATRKASLAAVPSAGPVTLDEARALAQARQPKRALSKAAQLTAPQSPEPVAEKRKELKQEREAERSRRIRDYKATMAIMKARGARSPRAKAKLAAGTDGDEPAALAKTSFAPLQIFAEGDSWFDYPPFYLRGGAVISRLEDLLGVPILNLAKAGDEVRFMLGVEERAAMAKHLTDGSPAGGPWDALLFSGGGNDIVDNPMVLWINDWKAGQPPSALINQPRFNAALALVRAGYEDLIMLRDQISPETFLIFHAYDFALPDGRGICGFGPWLKPSFDMRKFPSMSAGAAVVKAMLEQFAAMLASLAATHPKVAFVNGQGTLTPLTSSWHNELHPTRSGFDQFAVLFQQHIKVLFPNRVA